MGGMQGVQGLREEMSDLLLRSEKMREEHSSLLRLSQVSEIYFMFVCVCGDCFFWIVMCVVLWQISHCISFFLLLAVSHIHKDTHTHTISHSLTHPSSLTRHTRIHSHTHTRSLPQVRQAELEQSNVELSIGIAERQREISRLKLQQEQVSIMS